MYTRRRIILATCSLVLALSSGSAVVWAKGKQPKKTNGRYDARIAGYYSGTGSGAVRNSKVSVQSQVTTEAGASGVFNAQNMLLDGDHFGGPGLVFGKPVTIQGRLDGYDQDNNFKGARLLATYVDADGNVGRIAGVIR